MPETRAIFLGLLFAMAVSAIYHSYQKSPSPPPPPKERLAIFVQ